MGENQRELLLTLAQLSEVDGRIAGVLAERKRVEEALRTKQAEVAELTRVTEDRSIRANERKKLYERGAQYVRVEQQKLIDRRKALSSVGDYKTQMAAEREIEHASKQLGAHEEKLIEVLQQVENFEKDEQQAQEALTAATDACRVLEEDKSETIKSFEERLDRHNAERAELIATIDRAVLNTYDRVRSKYPVDAVVPVVDHACGGCFMEIGPQVVVDIGRGQSLVRCRGCGRILYIKDSEEE